MNSDELLERLNVANRQLRSILEDLERGSDKSASSLADRLQSLLSSLAHVRDLSPSDLNCAFSHPRISHELRDYRQQLTRLTELLPGIQVRLLTERASLEKERLHLASASAWVESNRETLVGK